MAEWLRRVIRNHMGYARVGSNPTAVERSCVALAQVRLLQSEWCNTALPLVRERCGVVN